MTDDDGMKVLPTPLRVMRDKRLRGSNGSIIMWIIIAIAMEDRCGRGCYATDDELATRFPDVSRKRFSAALSKAIEFGYVERRGPALYVIYDTLEDARIAREIKEYHARNAGARA